MDACPDPSYATLDDWIAQESFAFSLDDPERFDAAVDRLVAGFPGPVKLLGFGEALHGGSELLALRNRLFSRLVEAHGFSAIAIESSFPRGRLVDDHVSGRGPAAYDGIADAGFSHGFGRLEGNRELTEWMREYNADPSHAVKLRFYGYDSPTEMTHTESPRRLLEFVLDYLGSVGGGGPERRERIGALLGPDADWENPAAMMDPAQSVGRTPAANALRVETEDLIADLRVRRPELAAGSGEGRYREAVQYAATARQLLAYHGAVATPGGAERVVRLLGMRDAMMADALAYIAGRERDRGRVLAFGHNSHLRLGRAEWLLAGMALAWWTAGAHLDAMLGEGYAVVGTAVGVSEANGIGRPEDGTLEARLVAAPGPGRFVPTHRGRGLPAAAIAALPVRSGSTRNSGYFPLAPRSLAEFDWLAVLDSTGYDPGGPPLPDDLGAPRA